MNTNTLKKFAQETRKKLIAQIGAKLEFVLHSDSVALREKESQIIRLKEEIAKSSKAQVIDKVAYTWFNRLMALRFMDVNDFQPLGIRIISPKEEFTTPEILDEAKRGNIPTDLTVKKERIFDLLDGKIPSANPQNEVFKDLLIAACNHLHKTLPFLFERINDYTDLLLPDDMTSDFSIVQDIRNGMSEADCKEVEIIGWLYQFYISEKKDEVFASKAAVKKEDIPAATQLFTPRWIVEYMVQNTVGKLWIQNRPNSKLREVMPYFIESPSVSPSGEISAGQRAEDYLKINSVEEIKLLDQACGSGHILVYGFDLFYKMYEEEGYNSNEIPQLILKNNLFGFEIDERAAQLASMALIMKARSYNKRLFRESVSPNISCYVDLRLSPEEIQDTFRYVGVQASEALLQDLKIMGNATNFGSLIYPSSDLSDLKTLRAKLEAKAGISDAFLIYQIEQLQIAVNQLIRLGEKYHCVVDNPPYMGGGNMNKELSTFVKTNYPKSKADLMACFMEAGLKVLLPKGFLGMINQHSWMFLSSYEALRKDLVENTFFDTLLHLGPRTFPEIGGEVVQNASFTFWNTTNSCKGSYIRLIEFDKSELKRQKTLEAIQNPNCVWFKTAKQKDYEKIPGNPIAYWISKSLFNAFTFSNLNETANVKAGLSTGDNERFIRTWSEIDLRFITFNKNFQQKWIPLHKGGSVRKWYGNQDLVVNWENDGEEIRNYRDVNGKLRSRPQGLANNFRNGLTWSALSNSLNLRVSADYFIFGSKGPGITLEKSSEEKCNSLTYILGFLNSKIAKLLVGVQTQNLSFEVGHVGSIPVKFDQNLFPKVIEVAQSCINVSKENWDSNESSWDFHQNELIRVNGQDIAEAYDLYKQYWENKFFQLHKNEEELNQQFIEIYELNDELTTDVPLDEITILKNESVIQEGQLKYKPVEVFAQFISYAVGCMFGRYSLEKEGLILANQGETLEDYFAKIGASDPLSNRFTISNRSPLDNRFIPDSDNIIPVLDDEWFEDDIVARFKEFLIATFGKENLEKNLAFVESCIGKDIRKYFVKDFYTDHIQRYKKRPIYWMFSSAKGSFNVLIYMHRYTPDTLSKILNDYLNQYREKLKGRVQHLDHLIVSGSSTEQTKAAKEKDKIRGVLLELQEYERDILYPLATDRIPIDLDDGVLVNYNKFGQAIKDVKGLNDKKTKDKVRGFDWIDKSRIR